MTLYALKPGVELGDLDRPPAVPPLEHGGSYLADAVALWRLVDDRRADTLQEFLERSENAEDRHPIWNTAQVGELAELLTGLEERLQAEGVIDAGWLIAPDRAAGLARRVPGMDVGPGRGDADLANALAEVIARVHGLRTFLTKAADAGARVEMA